MNTQNYTQLRPADRNLCILPLRKRTKILFALSSLVNLNAARKAEHRTLKSLPMTPATGLYPRNSEGDFAETKPHRKLLAEFDHFLHLRRELCSNLGNHATVNHTQHVHVHHRDIGLTVGFFVHGNRAWHHGGE